MSPSAVLATLLRQTVIPTDPVAAASIIAVVAACSRQASGLGLIIGHGAYEHPDVLDQVEVLLSS